MKNPNMDVYNLAADLQRRYFDNVNDSEIQFSGMQDDSTAYSTTKGPHNESPYDYRSQNPRSL